MFENRRDGFLNKKYEKMKDYLDRNREVLFLNKKELMKLNRKERQDYLSTKKRYNKFQEPLMTGMIKHIENAHEFNSAQHDLDENYLIETYEEIINKESFAKELSEIKKAAKKDNQKIEKEEKKKRKKGDSALEKKVKELEMKVEEMESNKKPLASFIKKADISDFKWFFGLLFVIWFLYAAFGEWKFSDGGIFLLMMALPLLLGVGIIWNALKGYFKQK